MNLLNSPPIPPAQAGQALSLKAFCPAAAARRKGGRGRFFVLLKASKGGELVVSANKFVIHIYTNDFNR